MNDKKVEQVVVLEFVMDQPMVSRCGKFLEVMHASFTVCGCVRVCFPDFNCESMYAIHNQNPLLLKRCTDEVLMK